MVATACLAAGFNLPRSAVEGVGGFGSKGIGVLGFRVFRVQVER